MPPVAVGTAALLVRKTVRRIPFGNLALPAEWDTVEPELIVDAGSGEHLNRCGGQDFKPDPRGCYHSEVMRVREEFKDFCDGSFKRLLCFKKEGSHF